MRMRLYFWNCQSFDVVTEVQNDTKNVNCWSVRLWNSAVAVLTCGSLIHGIIAVSGRSSEYDWCYYAVGAVFVVSAVINYVRTKLQAGKPFCR